MGGDFFYITCKRKKTYSYLIRYFMYNRSYYFSRPIVLLAHGSSCWLCDRVSFTLEVHHVDKNTLNNSLFNLVPLCPPCHKISHKFTFVFNLEQKPQILNKIVQLEDFRRCFYQ